jgi:cytidyltransferase-like protein
MKKVFVSGCYDIIHAGHIKFFQDAKALGDYLIVCFASSKVLENHKDRKSSLPDDHKEEILKNLKCVDEVVKGEHYVLGLDFKQHFLRTKPDILAVTEDDLYSESKKKLCKETGVSYVVLPKTPPKFDPVSTTTIINRIKAPSKLPLRVDFAGGWLDVPKNSKNDSFIVNCAIRPFVSLRKWRYPIRSGLGGSAAWAILNGEDSFEKELKMGAGWQDPAIIKETGVCVWNSGDTPRLEIKKSGDFLNGKMGLYWTGKYHDTKNLVDIPRNYDKIAQASVIAKEAVYSSDISLLAKAINLTYEAQLEEGMDELPNIPNAIAKKYCGSGHGGYALYLFKNIFDRNNVFDFELEYIEPYYNLH